MQKPSPQTFTFYSYPEFKAYVAAARPSAVSLAEPLDWRDDDAVIDCDDLAQDVVRFPAIYPSGASADVAWLKSEFSPRIHLRR